MTIDYHKERTEMMYRYFTKHPEDRVRNRGVIQTSTTCENLPTAQFQHNQSESSQSNKAPVRNYMRVIFYRHMSDFQALYIFVRLILLSMSDDNRRLGFVLFAK